MVGGVGDVPVGWEVEGGVALLGLALVDDLRRQEGASRFVGQDEGDLSFVIHTSDWYLLCTLRMESPVGSGDDVDTCVDPYIQADSALKKSELVLHQDLQLVLPQVTSYE